MYKRGIGIFMGIMMIMVVAVSQLNTKVYAFSFDVEETTSVSCDKAEMFAKVIEANAGRLAQCETVEPTNLYRAIADVNVREAQNTDSEIIGVLPEGDVVSVIAIEGDWCVVQYNEFTAFVYADYLENI